MQKEIKLSHSDQLQLLFDYKIRKEGGTANTSQLLIELDDFIEAGELKSYLLSNKYFKQLVNTSLVLKSFRKERYRFVENGELFFSEVNYDGLDYSVVFQDDNLGAKPLKITLIHLPNKSLVLIQVNHVFIDNNGVKNLLRSFGGQEYEFHRTIKPEVNSFFKRLAHGLEFSKMMLSKWREPISHIVADEKSAIDKKYIIYDFTAEQTKFIQSKIVRSHRIKSMSSLLMANYCLVLKELILNNGGELEKFNFQQPFEMTSKKEPQYILGNRFAFFHYRFKPQEITTVENIQKEINKQTIDQMKSKVISKSLDLQSFLRFLKFPIQYWMMNLPAKGKMTSFAQTFIGETKIIDQFAGRKIVNMINIPPVMKNPPVTFGGVYYEGNFRVMMCYDGNSLSKEDGNGLIESLKAHLLENESDDQYEYASITEEQRD